MKKNNLLMLVTAMVIIAIAAVKVTNAETIKTEIDSNPNHSMKRWVSSPESTKTEVGIKDDRPVAWFVANSKEARIQNKVCHSDPSIQLTPNCINSLQALQMVFAGASGR
jgi:hypothetical protein